MLGGGELFYHASVEITQNQRVYYSNFSAELAATDLQLQSRGGGSEGAVGDSKARGDSFCRMIPAR